MRSPDTSSALPVVNGPISAALVGKRRYTLPTATPARSATADTEQYGTQEVKH